MKLFLLLTFIGASVYFLLKLAVVIYRPFYLDKLLREIERKFTEIKTQGIISTVFPF
jgi:hypothetical protein